MAKTAYDYPIQTGYGCLKGYPINKQMCDKPGYGFHRGVDRPMPRRTPIVLNNVQIGLSGMTGFAKGPHLHIGKWGPNGVMNPTDDSRFFSKGSKVIAVNHNAAADTLNGKYVKVRSAKTGYVWVFLHMDRVDVAVGQTL